MSNKLMCVSMDWFGAEVSSTVCGGRPGTRAVPIVAALRAYLAAHKLRRDSVPGPHLDHVVFAQDCEVGAGEGRPFARPPRVSLPAKRPV